MGGEKEKKDRVETILFVFVRKFHELSSVNRRSTQRLARRRAAIRAFRGREQPVGGATTPIVARRQGSGEFYLE